jgi:hypothetical protein
VLDIMLQPLDDEPVVKLSFEHSLLSLSKWEALHEKPFFGREPKTPEETMSYVRQMLLTDNAPDNFIDRLTADDYKSIADYINSNQTATTFAPEPQQRGSSELITNELIYFWLIQFNIPFHPVETWHLNRLMVLVKVVGIKQSKPKKMSKQELAEKYRSLNEQRRQQSGSAG